MYSGYRGYPRGKSVAFLSGGRVYLSGIYVKGIYVCLMFSLRSNAPVMVYRALHAFRVSVFYRVLPVLTVTRS